MTKEQREELLQAVQAIGFSLNESFEYELRLVTGIEEALIHDKWDHLKYLNHDDNAETTPYDCPLDLLDELWLWKTSTND